MCKKPRQCNFITSKRKRARLPGPRRMNSPWPGLKVHDIGWLDLGPADNGRQSHASTFAFGTSSRLDLQTRAVGIPQNCRRNDVRHATGAVADGRCSPGEPRVHDPAVCESAQAEYHDRVPHLRGEHRLQSCRQTRQCMPQWQPGKPNISISHREKAGSCRVRAINPCVSNVVVRNRQPW